MTTNIDVLKAFVTNLSNQSETPDKDNDIGQWLPLSFFVKLVAEIKELERRCGELE